MANRHGDFIWYELMTTDAEAAQTFYGGLLGWTFREFEQSGMDYRLFAADGPDVGGVMPLTEEMRNGGARPLWAGYIGVEDIDDAVDAVREADGEVLMGPEDIPGVGRFAFVKDPQGAPFYIMRPGPSEHASESFAARTPRDGHCAWNELATSDPSDAKRFYGSVFGWVTNDTLDLGPMGKYEMLKNGVDRDFMFGAVMKQPEAMPASLWSFYFRVPSIAEASRKIAQGGGQVVNGPMEIPGGDFSLNAVDPQGALFALVGKQ